MPNGTYPVDYSTDVAMVRLLVPDLTTDTGDTNGDFMFSDIALTALLGLYGQNVKRAAARAIEIVATDQALLTKVIRTDDLSVNGATLADALLRQAKALRDEANNDDVLLADNAFAVVYPDLPWYLDLMAAEDRVSVPEGTAYPWR